MKWDLLLIAVGMCTVGLIAWSVAGNPPRHARLHADKHVTDVPDLKLVTERSR